MKKQYFTVLVFCIIWVGISAQAPHQPNSAEIHAAIKKLQVLASALYVAAHPDDENTRLIAYLANEAKANTAYLSLTRGDGGQNLIGAEMAELLGVIRTNELLAARKIDGGQQMFSRANDFGYSKHPDETLRIWNKNEVLGDVVWAIRKFQPDVIINRFDHRTAGRTHGHHTSSALLSVEAFDRAADKSAYPEQLQYVKPWHPRRLYFNTSWFFYGSPALFDKADKSFMDSLDAGVYYPLLGKSNTEIAAEARSMHKCQGFGSVGTRGTDWEYIELIKGDKPVSNANIFEGIDITWTRLEGGAPIGKILKEVEENFQHENPSASIPQLINAYKLMKALPESHWQKVKMAEIEEIIKDCLGLYVETIADDFSATPGQNLDLFFEVINRGTVDISLKSMQIEAIDFDSTLTQRLSYNEGLKFKKTVTLPVDIPLTSPYWLAKKWELGMYTVEDQLLRGLPSTPPALNVNFLFNIEGEEIDLKTAVVHRRRDPVDGEVYRPFEVIPPVFANIAAKVYVLPDDEPKTVEVLVKAGRDNVSGTVTLCHPEDWQIEPKEIDIELNLKGEEKLVRFALIPPSHQSEGLISPLVKIGEESYTKEVVVIQYDHIPVQTVVRNAEAKVVRLDLKKQGDRIGYIMGAGDAIPESLEQIGYKVTILKDEDITPETLKTFDAVILGIRAYNTVDRLKFHQPKLLEYVKTGGTLIVQYNTSRGLVVDDLAPYTLELSRDRVSVEEAEVRLLRPDHEVLNFPNKITKKDFEGWVQERGLYFPDKWDERFTAVLSSNDPGESPKDGGLLVAPYGKGHYIYTGYSWFRELPAGVPGAYRIFTNLISIGKKDQIDSKDDSIKK